MDEEGKLFRVRVFLDTGNYLAGEPFEMDVPEIQGIIQKFLQAEGQRSFVLDMGERGWVAIPTRSINYITIEPVK